MRFIVCDGGDNCGKTNVIKRIEDFYKKSGVNPPTVLKFPSAEIFKTDVARRLFGEGDESARPAFIDMIVDEARVKLSTAIKEREENPNAFSEEVIVDRLFVSTLVYQGSGAEGSYANEQLICEKYDEMFRSIGVSPNQVYHYVFAYPIKTCDKGETDPLKLKLDAKAALHTERTLRLIPAIDCGVVRSEYLRNLTVFGEGEYAYWCGQPLPDEEIDDIQAKRANQIIYTHVVCGDV